IQRVRMLIFHKNQSRETIIDLFSRFLVYMRMEPKGRRFLIHCKIYLCATFCFNRMVRASIYIRRDLQSMPVKSGLLFQFILKIDMILLTSSHLYNRPQIRTIISVRLCEWYFTEGSLTFIGYYGIGNFRIGLIIALKESG